MSEEIAAIYCRVSREEQAEGWSPDAQVHLCKEFCQKRDYIVKDEFIFSDLGRSGKNTKRPGFQTMLRAAMDGRINVIVVHKLDRFSRSIIDILLTLMQFKKQEIGFVSATESFDFTTPSGKAMLLLLALFAEWYLENLSQETSKGKKERFRQGHHNGQAPFGYSMPCVAPLALSDAPAPKSVVVPDSNAVGVKLAFDLYATGKYSDEDIAQALNQRGYKTTGNRKRKGIHNFTKETVWAMLQNPFYIGKVTYIGLHQKKKKRSERVVQIVPGKHVPIIPQDLFDLCQTVRASKRRKGNSSHRYIHPHLFGRQIAKCHCCGEALRTENHFYNKQRHYLRCTSVLRGIECKASQKRIVADYPTRQINALITSVKLPEDWRAQVLEMVGQRDEREIAEAKKNKLKEQIRRLNKQYDSEAITDAEYTTRLRELKTLLAQAETATVEQAAVISAGELIEDMKVVWATATEQERQDLLRQMVRQVIVDTTKSRILEIEPNPAFVTLFRSTPNMQETSPGHFVVPEVDIDFPLD